MSHQKENIVKPPNPGKKLNLKDLPTDILSLITSYYRFPSLVGLRCSHRLFHSMTKFGFDEVESIPEISHIKFVDATGSMREAIRKLRPSMIATWIFFKEKFPKHHVLQSFVAFSDVTTSFTHSTEIVNGRPENAKNIYTGKHFISIQPFMSDPYKIWSLSKEIRATGGNTTTGTESMGQAIIQILKRLGSKIIKYSLCSKSLAIAELYHDTPPHFLGADGQENFYELFLMHGLPYDWFKALKDLCRKGVILIDYNLGNTPCSRYFGLIVASLGGYSFNITSDKVFDTVRLTQKITKTEIATREYLSSVYAQISSQMFGKTAQEIRAAVEEYVDQDTKTIPNYLFDLNPGIMNIPPEEFRKRITQCETLKDLQNAGLAPTEAYATWQARKTKGNCIIMGRTNPEAVAIRKRREQNVSGASTVSNDSLPVLDLLPPSIERSRTLCELPDLPSSLKETRSCATPLPEPILRRSVTEEPSSSLRADKAKSVRTVGFASDLCTVHEIPRADETKSGEVDEDELPPGRPSFERESTEILPISFGLTRTRTEMHNPMMYDTDFDDGRGDGTDDSDSLNIFAGTPWDGHWDSKALKEIFKPGIVRPPSRELIALERPREPFLRPVDPLEQYCRKETNLDKVAARIAQEQPSMAEAIKAGSWPRFVEKNFLSSISNEERELQRAIASSPPSDRPESESLGLPMALSSINRSHSLFSPDTEIVPRAPGLTRSRTEIHSTNPTVMRQLASQFDNF